MRRRLGLIENPNQRAFMRKVLWQRAGTKMRPGRHRMPGIAVDAVPELRKKYGYRKVRFADLTKQEQNALRKWRLKYRVRKGTITPEEHYLRLKRGKFIPKGLERKRLRKHGERWLSFAWYALPKEKEKFRMKKGPMAGMKKYGRIHGRRFGEKELDLIYKQKEFAFELLTRHLPKQIKEEFMEKMLSKEMLTRKMSTRALIDYPTIREVREETLANIRDLKQGKEMFGGYTHTRRGRDYLAPDFLHRKDLIFITSSVHEAVHQLRLYFFARRLPVPIRPVKGAPFYAIEDIPWAQALDRLYGLREGIYKFDKEIGNATKDDFERKERAYADPIKAIEEEPEWSFDAGKRIGQWAFKRFGPEGGANYIFLRIWGKNHREAYRIIVNNKMDAALKEMKAQFRKNAQAEVVRLQWKPTKAQVRNAA